MTWKPISEFVYPDSPWLFAETASFIVYNGKRVGEAVAEFRSSWDDDNDEDGQSWQWSWTHHSTCSCCFEIMDPQPEWFQPMPEPPQ